MAITQSPTLLHMKSQRYARVALTTATIGIGTYGYDHTHDDVLSRGTRALYTLTYVGIRYARADYQNQLAVEAIHEDCAERILHMLTKNKGLFIKIGQAIANQGPLFPVAYQKRFARLYDNAPQDSWRDIKAMLDREYGGNPWGFKIVGDVVALASIAQVYRGILDLGEEVAVKVQHPYIANQIVVDLWVYRTISKFYGFVFDFPFLMFTKYISSQISQETNFENEAKNGQRLMSAFANDGLAAEVYVPKVYSSVSTLRVLVSEWIDGLLLTDTEEVAKNFLASKLLNTFLNVFGRQIFNYGFVHADPHPGNLKVRRLESGKQQLVILDHGLYTDIPSKFRKEYQRLWLDIFIANSDDMQDIANNWGLNSLELIALVILLKPTYLVLKPPEQQIEDDRTIQTLLGEFLQDELKFPLQLIFLTRTQRMMQNMNQQYGLPVNRMNILTRCSIQNSDLTWGQNLFISTALWFSDMMFLVVRFKQWVVGDLLGKPSWGIEDYLELFMKNTAKSHGITI